MNDKSTLNHLVKICSEI